MSKDIVNFEILMPNLSAEKRERLLNGDMYYRGEIRIYRDVVLQELAERGITLEEFERLRHVGSRGYETLEGADKTRLTKYKERQE
ncbi:MAG: hypothetical protein HRU20_21250 [Pseudomonadales bacterium]|nr:hypothetical protein [Pseudomonadales bacterium]